MNSNQLLMKICECLSFVKMMLLIDVIGYILTMIHFIKWLGEHKIQQ